MSQVKQAMPIPFLGTVKVGQPISTVFVAPAGTAPLSEKTVEGYVKERTRAYDLNGDGKADVTVVDRFNSFGPEVQVGQTIEVQAEGSHYRMSAGQGVVALPAGAGVEQITRQSAEATEVLSLNAMSLDGPMPEGSKRALSTSRFIPVLEQSVAIGQETRSVIPRGARKLNREEIAGAMAGGRVVITYDLNGDGKADLTDTQSYWNNRQLKRETIEIKDGTGGAYVLTDSGNSSRGPVMGFIRHIDHVTARTAPLSADALSDNDGNGVVDSERESKVKGGVETFTLYKDTNGDGIADRKSVNARKL